MKLTFILSFLFWFIGFPSFNVQVEAEEVNTTFVENNDCVPAQSSDIQGFDDYTFCPGEEALLKVFSNSVDSPVFTWYADQELTVIISQGSELILDSSISLEKVFVSVEGPNTCRSEVGEAKQIDVGYYSISEPLLPKGMSYFSPQGFGVDILAEYPDLAQADNFEFHWFDEDGSLMGISPVFMVDKELPRGFYQYSVASKNTLTGCLSNRLEFTVVVDDTEIPLDNCTVAGSYTISSNICPSCTVDLPDNAVDYNTESYSELRAVKNVFNGGFIGQNLIFPIVGNKGDSVSVSISLPTWNGQLDKLSSISLSLYNGTRKVSSEYFLNTDAVHIKKAGDIYKFTVAADLQDNSESYVSVLVKSYTALPDFFANVRVHAAEMIFAIPTYPSDPFTTCEGTNTRISAIPGENTFLRWYSTETGGQELSSGNGYTTPKLSEPGEYIYWVSVFRSNCESYARYPVRVSVTARPKESDLEVDGGGEYCHGDIVILKPGIQKESQFSQDEIKFLWYYDALGVNKVTQTDNIKLSTEGDLTLQDYEPGEYAFFLSAESKTSCMLLPPDFKKVQFKIREEIQPPVFSNVEIELCSELNPTLETLKATGNVQVKWYQDQGLQSPLSHTTHLEDGVTYYAVTLNQYNCESIQSAPVTVRLKSCAPVLSITKSPLGTAPHSVTSGEEMQYSILIRNEGIFTAYNLLLEDPLPAGTSYVSSTPEGQFDSEKVSWTLDSLPGGESRVFELRLLVSPSLEEGTILRNTAYLTGPDGELEDESEPVTVRSESSLSIEKELLSAASVYPGDTVRYSISVQNSGPSEAFQLRVVDDLPDELEYVGSEGGVYQSSTHEVVWELDRLGVGERVSFELITRVSLSKEPGLVRNAVTVLNRRDEEEDTDTNEEVEVVPLVPGLFLKKTLQGDTEVLAGSELIYQLLIENRGRGTAYNLLLEDPLPAGTSYVSSTPEGQFDSEKVSWTLDSLPGGESRVFELRLLVSPSLEEGTILRNTAYLTGPDGELEDESEPVTVRSESSLSIEKELLSAASVYPGDTVRYSISVQNSGPSEAFQLRVVDDLPDELEYVGSEGGVYQSSTHEVVWELDRLGVGERVSFELITRVSLSKEPGLVRNAVTVLNRRDEEEDTDTNEEVEVVPLVPGLFLKKTLQGDTEVLAGSELIYQLLIENRGRGTAYNLLLEDPLPAGTSYVSSTPEGQFDSEKVSWTLDSLPGGESRVFELRLLVSPSLEEGTILRNTAYLTGPDGELEDESEPVTVRSESSLSIEKELLSAASVYPGDTVRYSISVQNSGPSEAFQLRVVDDLPDELEYVGSEGGVYQSSTHEVVWELDRLGVGERVSFELITRVSLSKEPGLVRNAVTVLNRRDEEEDTDTNEEVEVILTEKVELQIEKSINSSPVSIGGEFRFGIQLKNVGSLSLTNLILTDTLQPYLDFLTSEFLPSANDESVLTWEVDDLAPGESLSWEFVVLLDYQPDLVGGEITNKIWATAEGHPDMWSAEVTGEIFGPPLSEWEVDKELIGDLFNIGDVVQYGISILNKGEHPIRNVKMKDYFPSGLQFLGVDGPGSLELFDTDSLEITIPILEVGQHLDFTLSFLLVEYSQGMINVVTASADNAPDVTDSTEILDLKEVDVTILKEVSSPLVEVGKEFSYKITVSNISEVEASFIEVIDVLPTQMEYIRSDYTVGLASFNSSERLLTWNIEKLLPGEVVELTVIVLATTEGKSIANSTSVTSHEQDSDYSNNESTVIHVQFSIHFPNVFTPNGDGINDTWEITGISLFPDNSLAIVNRWGVEVYAADNYKNVWTGGNLVEGTYFYSFKWTDESNHVYEKTGFIHLKR